MKNKKGFTLIELLAVIVVLAIVMVLATTTVLPYMTQAREKAFRIEATSAVEAASNAYDLYTLNQISLGGSETTSCKRTNYICFTIAELVDLGLYEGDVTNYSGTVTIDTTNSKNPSYTLNFKKGTEYVLIGQTGKNFNDNGTLGNVADWADDDEGQCTCVE